MSAACKEAHTHGTTFVFLCCCRPISWEQEALTRVSCSVNILFYYCCSATVIQTWVNERDISCVVVFEVLQDSPVTISWCLPLASFCCIHHYWRASPINSSHLPRPTLKVEGGGNNAAIHQDILRDHIVLTSGHQVLWFWYNYFK